MKRVFIFIGLKVIEIIGGGSVLFTCNRIGMWIFSLGHSETELTGTEELVGSTIVGVCVVFVVFVFLRWIIPAWFRVNWDKAGEIVRRGK